MLNVQVQLKPVNLTWLWTLLGFFLVFMAINCFGRDFLLQTLFLFTIALLNVGLPSKNSKFREKTGKTRGEEFIQLSESAHLSSVNSELVFFLLLGTEESSKLENYTWNIIKQKMWKLSPDPRAQQNTKIDSSGSPSFMEITSLGKVWKILPFYNFLLIANLLLLLVSFLFLS